VIARCLGSIFGGVVPKKAPYCRNPILAAEMTDDAVRAALERRTTLPIAWSPGPLLRTIARELLKRPGALGTAMRWLVLLTRYRYAIAGRLFGLYGQAEPGISIAAPAMIDFDLWLGEGRDLPETESLARQVRLMEQLVRLFDGRIAPLVPFDPWRHALWSLRAARGQARAGPSPLHLVADAVTQRGFVGVKLYPPMGFRPQGNADFRPRPGDDPTRFPVGYAADFGDAPTFARALDRALAELYALCAREAIPVMTHTRDSQVLVHPLGLRANPRHWQPILAAHGRMNVNLAHVGNMYEMAGDAPRQNAEEGWADHAFFLMDRYHNAFGDVGYFKYIAALDGAGLVGGVWRAKAETFFGNLGRMLEKYPRAGRRLMYGSDWSMLGHINGHESYLRAFAASMTQRHPELANRFLGGAAAEFFGFYEFDRRSRPSPAFRRLRRFYARHRLCDAAAFQLRFFGGRGPDGPASGPNASRERDAGERLRTMCPQSGT
jgi:hypothetical protein